MRSYLEFVKSKTDDAELIEMYDKDESIALLLKDYIRTVMKGPIISINDMQVKTTFEKAMKELKKFLKH